MLEHSNLNSGVSVTDVVNGVLVAGPTFSCHIRYLFKTEIEFLRPWSHGSMKSARQSVAYTLSHKSLPLGWSETCHLWR